MQQRSKQHACTDMTTNAWGAPTGGASNSWADDVHEEEQAGTLPNPDFPTLGEAAKAPPPAKKKAKGQKLGLGQFLAAGGGPAPPPVTSRVTDADILRLLPTAPRADRDPDEANAMGALGGGFREYGGDRGNRGFSGGEQHGSSSWCCRGAAMLQLGARLGLVAA